MLSLLIRICWLKKSGLKSIIFADEKPLPFSWSIATMEEIQGCHALYWCSLIHSRSRRRKAEMLMASHLCTEWNNISWFQILICVYFSIFFIILFYSSVCKKDEANLLDPQASKPCVTARRRCSLNLLWC